MPDHTVQVEGQDSASGRSIGIGATAGSFAHAEGVEVCVTVEDVDALFAL
jgi:hypothetical protein